MDVTHGEQVVITLSGYVADEAGFSFESGSPHGSFLLLIRDTEIYALYIYGRDDVHLFTSRP